MFFESVNFNNQIVKDIIETDNVVKGDLIIFTEDVYSKNFYVHKIIGRRTILARIYNHNYGEKYITFSMEVIDCIGTDSDKLIIKKYIKRREPTLFKKYKVYRQIWKTEIDEINRFYFLDAQHVFKHSLIQTEKG